MDKTDAPSAADRGSGFSTRKDNMSINDTTPESVQLKRRIRFLAPMLVALLLLTGADLTRANLTDTIR